MGTDFKNINTHLLRFLSTVILHLQLFYLNAFAGEKQTLPSTFVSVYLDLKKKIECVKEVCVTHLTGHMTSSSENIT